VFVRACDNSTLREALRTPLLYFVLKPIEDLLLDCALDEYPRPRAVRGESLAELRRVATPLISK
jgi:hypothetical protein